MVEVGGGGEGEEVLEVFLLPRFALTINIINILINIVNILINIVNILMIRKVMIVIQIIWKFLMQLYR